MAKQNPNRNELNKCTNKQTIFSRREKRGAKNTSRDGGFEKLEFAFDWMASFVSSESIVPFPAYSE